MQKEVAVCLNYGTVPELVQRDWRRSQKPQPSRCSSRDSNQPPAKYLSSLIFL